MKNIQTKKNGTVELRQDQRRNKKRIKITKEGQPCRHCGTPVVKKQHNVEWQPKAGQSYCFDFWFKCPNKKCRKLYLVEAAKVFLREEAQCESGGRHSTKEEAIECIRLKSGYIFQSMAIENVNFGSTNYLQ